MFAARTSPNPVPLSLLGSVSMHEPCWFATWLRVEVVPPLVVVEVVGPISSAFVLTWVLHLVVTAAWLVV